MPLLHDKQLFTISQLNEKLNFEFILKATLQQIAFSRRIINALINEHIFHLLRLLTQMVYVHGRQRVFHFIIVIYFDVTA